MFCSLDLVVTASLAHVIRLMVVNRNAFASRVRINTTAFLERAPPSQTRIRILLGPRLSSLAVGLPAAFPTNVTLTSRLLVQTTLLPFLDYSITVVPLYASQTITQQGVLALDGVLDAHAQANLTVMLSVEVRLLNRSYASSAVPPLHRRALSGSTTRDDSETNGNTRCARSDGRDGGMAVGIA